jgi:anti-sigma B factor antagonist
VSAPHVPTADQGQPPDLVIDVATRDGCSVVTVSGELDVLTAPRLRQVLFDPVLCSRPHVVVDLRDVGFIDSTGIGTLVAARRWTSSRSTSLSLVCDPGPVLRVLDLVSLTRIFEVHDSVEAAVALG